MSRLRRDRRNRRPRPYCNQSLLKVGVQDPSRLEYDLPTEDVERSNLLVIPVFPATSSGSHQLHWGQPITPPAAARCSRSDPPKPGARCAARSAPSRTPPTSRSTCRLLHPCIALCAFAGLRLGEAAAVQIRELDFLRKSLKISRQVQRVTGGAINVRAPKYGSERVGNWLPASSTF